MLVFLPLGIATVSRRYQDGIILIMSVSESNVASNDQTDIPLDLLCGLCRAFQSYQLWFQQSYYIHTQIKQHNLEMSAEIQHYISLSQINDSLGMKTDNLQSSFL